MVPIYRSAQWTTIIVSSIIGAVVAGSLFGHIETHIGPFGLRLSWHVSPSAVTQLNFPPLGEVIARTHQGPTRLVATLESIHFTRLRQFINETADDHGEVVRTLTPAAERALSTFTGRLLLTGTVGASIAALLAQRLLRRKTIRRDVIVGALIGLATIGSLILVTRVTYTVDGFRSPTYRGALEEIPWLIRTVQDGLAQVEELDARLKRLSQSVYDMYRRVESLPPPTSLTEADFVILHVTDFHNHPTAASLVVEMATAFDADIVLNTGDLTDFGTRLETNLLNDFSHLRIPHYLVSGNHESPEVLEHIALLPYIELIDGRQIDVHGLRIVAIGDPRARVESAQSMTPAQAREHAREINKAIETMVPRPDIVTIHNHRVAQDIRPGLVPLVTFGHSHTAGIQFKEGTAYVNAGSTGGAGIRGLEASRAVPITMSVIYLRHRPPEETRVLAVDMVELSPDAGGFLVERHIAPLPALADQL